MVRSPETGGLNDLDGTVWEHVVDGYAGHMDAGCWGNAAQSNPLCTATTSNFTLRSGWWGNPADTLANNRTLLRAATRGFDPPTTTYEGVGFRCAR